MGCASGEKLNLKWNDFQINVLSSYKDLRQNVPFHDITLICHNDNNLQQQQQTNTSSSSRSQFTSLKAHKWVLSSSSTFFHDLFSTDKDNSTLQQSTIANTSSQLMIGSIYMNDISSTTLKYILDFIYCGEVSVRAEDLDAFISVGERLKIKGLTKEDSGRRRSKNHPRGIHISSSSTSQSIISSCDDPVIVDINAPIDDKTQETVKGVIRKKDDLTEKREDELNDSRMGIDEDVLTRRDFHNGDNVDEQSDETEGNVINEIRFSEDEFSTDFNFKHELYEDINNDITIDDYRDGDDQNISTSITPGMSFSSSHRSSKKSSSKGGVYKRHSERDKVMIQICYENGGSWTRLAKELGVPDSTARGWIKTGRFGERKNRWSKKTSPHPHPPSDSILFDNQ